MEKRKKPRNPLSPDRHGKAAGNRCFAHWLSSAETPSPGGGRGLAEYQCLKQARGLEGVPRRRPGGRLFLDMGFPVWYDDIIREKGGTTIDIKAKIEQIVEKLKKDDKLLEKFNKNPAAVIEEYVGVDLPDDLVNQIVEGVKAKLTVDKVGDALEGLGKLFGKK